MANGTKANQSNGAPAPARKSGLKLVLILFLAAALAAAAYHYFFFYGSHLLAGQREPAEPPVKTVDMGNLTVNLADLSGARYLRVHIVIELPEDKDLEAEFAACEHRIRHDVLYKLRQKTASEVRSPEGLDALCSELLEEVNSHLTKGQAKGLFFREYLVQ